MKGNRGGEGPSGGGRDSRGRDVEPGCAGAIDEVSRGLDRAVVALRQPALLQEQELLQVLSGLDTALARTQSLLVTVAREAIARGLHVGSGFSVIDWVRSHCPGLSTREAAEVATVARAGQEQVHQPLLDAVERGSVTVSRAASVLRALGRIRPAVGESEYAEATELLAAAAGDDCFDDKALTRITSKLVASCLSEREQVAREKARHELRDLHESSLADGSVRRFVLTVGDDADVATIQAILRSPLAAPVTAMGDDGDPTATTSTTDSTATATTATTTATTAPGTSATTAPGMTAVLDTRTPGQRRYDAFMTVLRRGVAGSQGQPTTPKAQVMVTMALDELTGALRGAGLTVHEGTLSAGQVRQLACEADLIPAVLGEQGEILDLGLARRLVTPGQRRVLAHRDQGCTFPGCHVPATWCDAHHVVHWARGGRSDLSNYALLCPRHHTWVHQHDATAQVDATGVRWKLR